MIELRPARAADVAGIFEVRLAVTENALTLPELRDMGITPEAVTTMIADAPCAWVAEDAGRIIGFSMIDIEAGALFAAFLHPSHEGRGLGARLVALAEAELFRRHDTIWLETGATTRAAGFYRHLGWQQVQDLEGGDIRLEKSRR